MLPPLTPAQLQVRLFVLVFVLTALGVPVEHASIVELLHTPFTGVRTQAPLLAL